MKLTFYWKETKQIIKLYRSLMVISAMDTHTHTHTQMDYRGLREGMGDQLRDYCSSTGDREWLLDQRYQWDGDKWSSSD